MKKRFFLFLAVAACSGFTLNQGYNKIFLSIDVNSDYPELTPLVSPDGEKLFFVRENDPGNTNYPLDECQDIWMSKLEPDGTWGRARHLNAPFNQNFNNSIIGFSSDGNTRYIKGYYQKGVWKKNGFSSTHLTKNGWTTPVGIDVKNYDRMLHETTTVSNYMHTDNNILLTSFLAKKSSSHDIFVSFKNGVNSFTEPLKLGLCTDNYDEISPFLASDGITLYFASDRPDGYGDFDIWMTRRLDETWMKWSEPVNLGPEINSAGWDAYYTIPASGDVAYMISKGEGGDDICKITLKEELRPKPVVLVKGKVFNRNTNQPIAAEITVQNLLDGSAIATANSNEETGEYQIILPQGGNYGFNASVQGCYALSENMNTQELGEYSELQKDLYLVPIEKGQIVRLNNIFFDFNKYELKPESFPELNRVVEMMNTNPGLKIEIGGHTDDIGTDESNKVLSQNRASAVKNYLCLRGISGDRITAIGYGEQLPVSDNSTENGRALNRRVELKITEK